MNIQVKVYKPDYGVILKNYLDPKNWESMVVYRYRDYTISIQLTSINVLSKTLLFEINTTCQETQYTKRNVTYKIDHPEYTLKVFETAVKRAMESSFISAVIQTNYKYTYEALSEAYNRERRAIVSEINDDIQSLYDNLPSMVRSVIDYDDLLDSIVDDKQLCEYPSYTSATKEYFEQELNIFNGIQTIIENRDFGEIDLTDSLKIIDALETGDYDELTEDELETLQEIIDVEDIDLENYI